jgi:hypothetical protein
MMKLISPLILVVKLVSPQVSCKGRFVLERGGKTIWKVEKMNKKGAILRRENNFEISWANIPCVGASLEESYGKQIFCGNFFARTNL